VSVAQHTKAEGAKWECELDAERKETSQ